MRRRSCILGSISIDQAYGMARGRDELYGLDLFVLVCEFQFGRQVVELFPFLLQTPRVSKRMSSRDTAPVQY